MPDSIKALLITAAIVISSMGYMYLLNIDGMPVWYYYTLFSVIPVLVVYSYIYVMVKRDKKEIK